MVDETNKYDLSRFQAEIRALEIPLSSYQMDQFLEFYALLIEWNKVMNLTAITEFEEVVLKHFIDSLTIVKVCDITQINRLIDVGTGAGFPGIPLKIAYPHLEVVLLDSLMKRIKFLNAVVDRLGLTRIETIHGRAEDYANQAGYREKFDLSVSRAVANLATLSEYCLPFAAPDGSFISYKSGKIDDELKQAEKAIQKLGGKIESCSKFYLPGSDMERSFVVIKKIKSTPKAFPRKAGLPAKEPIC